MTAVRGVSFPTAAYLALAEGPPRILGVADAVKPASGFRPRLSNAPPWDRAANGLGLSRLPFAGDFLAFSPLCRGQDTPDNFNPFFGVPLRDMLQNLQS